MEETNFKETQWFEAPEYNTPENEEKIRLPKFNINLSKGEIAKSEEIVFLNNGVEVNNQYGKSIMFNVTHKGVDMVWFIKSKSYSLLRPIRILAKANQLSGKTATVTRAGTTQADTRWGIVFK